MPKAPTKPEQYREAVRYFKTKTPMKKSAFEELEAQAKSRAFTVAGVAQMDVVEEVMRKVERAILKGETFEVFRKKVLPALKKAWGAEIPGRIETIFRTNLQTAYSAGRMEQLNSPEVRKVMTYWRMDVILDTRTTEEICRPIAGTLLPAGHPWFLKRTPPLHFRCRSVIRALRKRDVRGEGGVTKRPPKALPQEGFGQLKPLKDWKPDLRGYSSELVKKYRRKR